MGNILQEIIMTLDEVLEHKRFGTYAELAIALGIRQQNMTQWQKQGYIPWKQQFKIALLTEGELMPDEEDPNSTKPKGRWK